MLKTTLWIAAACAAVLLALAVSRGLRFDRPPAAPPPKAEAKAVTPRPKPKIVAAKVAQKAPSPPATKAASPPDQLQVELDAAATGMTTPAKAAPDDQPPT